MRGTHSLIAVSRYVTIERHGDVALVRLDRPPANAIDRELLRESHAVLEEVLASEPTAVVLTGREGFFSAGADLKAVPNLDAAGQREMVMGINRLCAGWYGFPRPVVCAVNGHAIAGGLVLALCGDYRVGATAGKLGLTELRVGIPYPAGAMAVVRAELSPPAARRLTLEAELVDPPTALALGLVDELADPASVVPRALEVAARLAEPPTGGYAAVKRQLRGDTIEALEQIVAQGIDPMIEQWLLPETQQASSAVLRGDS